MKHWDENILYIHEHNCHTPTHAVGCVSDGLV